MPADVRNNASQLILLRGSDTLGGKARTDTVALLVYTRMNPKMQLFMECGLVWPSGDTSRIYEPREPPFDLTILDRVSRSGLQRVGREVRRALAGCTSDELASFLLSQHPVWQLYPLEYKTSGGATLLKMRVLGKDAESTSTPVKRMPTPRASVVPDVFDLGDPFAYGASSAPGRTIG